MKVLIVDDKIAQVQGLINRCEKEKIECIFCDSFDDGEQNYFTNDYDLLILDLKKDPTEEYPGKSMLNKFWDNKFIPTIIFSSHFLETDKIIRHKFLKWYDKTHEIDVENEIVKHLKYCDPIKKVRLKINEIFKNGLEALDLTYSDDENSIVVLQYMQYGLMQKCYSEARDKRLPAKSQYVLFSQYSDLSATDIIERIPVVGEDASEFYMVVTASCDLANSEYKQVVCKKIKSMSHKDIEGLKGRRNDGGYRGKLLLPNNSYFSNMIVDCTETCVIQKEVISKDSEERNLSNYSFRKILAFVSPYKERIISMVYQHDGRIGVPDLDVDSWWKNE